MDLFGCSAIARQVYPSTQINVQKPFPKLGITLAGMNDFVTRIGGEETVKGLTTTQICELYVKPMTIVRPPKTHQFLIIMNIIVGTAIVVLRIHQTERRRRSKDHWYSQCVYLSCLEISIFECFECFESLPMEQIWSWWWWSSMYSIRTNLMVWFILK